MRTTTPFDPKRHHINLEAQVNSGEGLPWSIDALLDTGAPWTELSDKFLHHAGLLDELKPGVDLKPGLQSQSYGKIVLPELRVCGQVMSDFEVRISRFDPSWEIAALIGLDFFRRFPVTIDYQRAVVEVG